MDEDGHISHIQVENSSNLPCFSGWRCSIYFHVQFPGVLGYGTESECGLSNPFNVFGIIRGSSVCFATWGCFVYRIPHFYPVVDHHVPSETGLFLQEFSGHLLGQRNWVGKKDACWLGLSRNGFLPPNGNFNRGNGDKPVDLLFSPKVPRETSDDDIVCNGIPR
jgi:hypothetical protein